MKSLLLWIGLLGMFPTAMFSASTFAIQSASDTSKYQLVLVDPTQDREFLIPVGGRITCKDQGGRRYHGVVRGYGKEAILLREEKVEMQGLVSIKYYPKNKKWRRRAGAVLKVVAGLFATFGTGRGISTYSDDPESYNTQEFLILVFSSIVLAIPIFLLGMWMSKGARSTFNLKRKYDWYMEVVEKNP